MASTLRHNLDWTPHEARAIARPLGSFLDIAGTAMGRATFYNSRDEQERAEASAHDALFHASRPLYGIATLLPGVPDRARMRAASRLLRSGAGDAAERDVVDALASGLPAPRMLRLFEELRDARVNNARVRKLILRRILGSRSLELWSVKYRRKVRRALIHALGRRRSSVLRAMLAKSAPSVCEERELRRHLLRYAADEAVARECVRFVLGDDAAVSRPLLASFVNAKRDLSRGVGLPPEVLEGIRSTYHPHVAPSRALALGRSGMSAGQRMAVQRRAEEAGVKVEFDPRRQDAVRLYVYAFERGMTAAIEQALDEKAAAAARALPVVYERIGVLVDGSRSMIGSDEQHLRPMAVALAVRDVLAASARHVSMRVAGGVADGRLVRPEGDSSLASDLLALLREDLDAVYVLSDGYENAPAGRFAEVLGRARELGCATPVLQISPVFGAEARGLRRLAPDIAPALPVSKPDGMGMAILREQLDIEPLLALRTLVRLAQPRREGIR